jgi:hypothetical protein
MKIYKGRPLFAALLGALLLLAGCTGPLQDGGADSPDASGTGIGIVRVTLGGTKARTLLPDTDVLADLYYALRFSAQGKPEVSPVPVHRLNTEVELEPGTWALEVKGYATSTEAANPTGDPVVRGSAELRVQRGNVTPVSVALSAKAESGAGTLRYDIRFPGNADSARLVITAISGATMTELDLLTGAETDGAGFWKTGTQSLVAGYYRINPICYLLPYPNASILYRRKLVKYY